MEATLNDEDLLLDSSDEEDEQAKKPSLRISEYTPEVRALAALHNQLAILNANFVAANSGKKKGKGTKPIMYPEPETALAKARVKRRAKAHESLVSRVLPNRG